LQYLKNASLVEYPAYEPTYNIDFEGKDGGGIQIYKDDRIYSASVRLTKSSAGTLYASYCKTLEEVLRKAFLAKARGFGPIFEYLGKENTVINYLILRETSEWKDAREKVKVIRILQRKSR
jgi:hypothetical protein